MRPQRCPSFRYLLFLNPIDVPTPVVGVPHVAQVGLSQHLVDEHPFNPRLLGVTAPQNPNCFYGSASGLFLVGVAQGGERSGGRDVLVVALSVLLDHRPACAVGAGAVFTAELAVAVAEVPAGDVHIVAAVNAFFPVVHHCL